jgi:(1->4)-alpha-D-glucan 1-alpha-D-glucosylmutase
MESIPDKKIKETFNRVSSNLPHRIPVSTYRIQFNRLFTFRDAAAIIDYLDRLGISDIYASPYFRSRKGSMHGYDITDNQSLNPETGDMEDYERFVSELEKHGMGHILDIVPNHMSIAEGENAWWTDVLENGPCSPYAHYFDIDWKPLKDELEDKVIIPILGDHYGKVLEDGKISLLLDSGAFFITYYGHRLPVEPSTYTDVLTHRIEALEEKLDAANTHYTELLSIVTALKNLPPRTETDTERIAERLREKEIIKHRLNTLYDESSEFRMHIDENVLIFNGTRDEGESFDLLDMLLSKQVYRLAFWRVATEEINYRRFFDINDLAAIRTEDPEVFMKTHSLVFDLVRKGKITGLRVDHPDGLYDPNEYFRRLQEECFVQLCMSALGESDGRLEDSIRELYRERLPNLETGGMPFYIVGEKILVGNESLSEGWPIFGTTGYSFMNAVGGVLIDADGEKGIDGAYSRFVRSKLNYTDLLYEKKKLIMESSMAGEINVLGHSLNRIAENCRHFRDFTLNNLTDAIVEVIASFPVYRTYIDPSGVNEKDRRYVEMAITRARRRRLDLGVSIFDFLKDVLTLNFPEKSSDAQKKQWLDFTMKFQQHTGPVMAKGLEDTVFYVYNRLVSLNEVGGAPDRFGISVEAFHGQNIDVKKRWPYTLRATSTHDSKRSEDVRARLNVLSELPDEWKAHLASWGRMNRKLKTMHDGRPAPQRNEEYLLYQTLIGVWPMFPPVHAGFEDLLDRVKQYMIKAAREAKVNSNWLNPDIEYEEALARFIEGVMKSRRFMADFEPFQKKIAHFGMLNSLSQTLLKITSPGVPDFYQGSELWNLNLVDPDNRRPVDYAVMIKAIEELIALELNKGLLETAKELLFRKEDGHIKMYLIYKALNFRKSNHRLFLDGHYMPLHATGSRSANVIAFLRSDRESTTITAVPRLMTRLVDTPFGFPLGDVWENTRITIPMELSASVYENVLTGQRLWPGEGGLRLSEVLKDFPVALLKR